MIERKLLKQALSELVFLKSHIHDLTRFRGHLYTAALEDWAGRLSVDKGKLNKVVQIREAVSSNHLY